MRVRYLVQVCWMPLPVTWSSALCCFVALFEGFHAELILGEPHPLFISDPVLCQLDRTTIHVCIQRICCKICLPWPSVQMFLYSKSDVVWSKIICLTRNSYSCRKDSTLTDHKRLHLVSVVIVFVFIPTFLFLSGMAL